MTVNKADAMVRKVELLREQLDERGVDLTDLDGFALARVIYRIGDVDLAADALSMRRRPAWLSKLLRP